MLLSTKTFAHLFYLGSSSACGVLVQGGRAFVFLTFCYNVSIKVCLAWCIAMVSMLEVFFKGRTGEGRGLDGEMGWARRRGWIN